MHIFAVILWNFTPVLQKKKIILKKKNADNITHLVLKNIQSFVPSLPWRVKMPQS